MKVSATGNRFAREAAAEACEPFPLPPQKLDDAALHYWPHVLAGKRLSYWTSNDLVVACQIARDYAAMELLSEDIAEHGHTFTARGRQYPNPSVRILETVSTRIARNLRLVQAHSVATNGRIEGQRTKNAVAREITAKLGNSHALISRPQ